MCIRDSAYAHALDEGDTETANAYLETFHQSAKLADELGLEVHFGHGLTYDNVGKVAAIPEAMELNIGHFLMGEAIFIGLDGAIAEMRNMISEARAT